MHSFQQKIVLAARSWIGTPFHHQARLKGKGCDCLGLIIGVASALGLKDKHGQLLSSYDEVTYSKEPDGAYLIEKLSSLLAAIPFAGAQPGDLALFNIRDNPQHMAILTDYEGELGMIHAYAPARCVVEHRLDEEWQQRLAKVFRVPPKSGFRFSDKGTRPQRRF